MSVKQFTKKVIERRRLYVDYSRWLEDTEELSDFQSTVVPYTAENPLWLDTSYPDAENKRLMMYVQGGIANTTYTVQLVVSTDEGQVKRDDISFRVLA
jgi:hypothetical protein